MLKHYPKNFWQAPLVINPTDPWNIVIAKAISLRQLGRKDEAEAAFAKYEEMFARTDPTAKQYAHTARYFTQQIESLGIVDGAVYVFEIVEGSPVAQGGLAVSDIIVDFNGQEIRNMNDIQAALQNIPEGKPIEITFLRLDEYEIFHRQTIIVIGQKPLGANLMPI